MADQTNNRREHRDDDMGGAAPASSRYMSPRQTSQHIGISLTTTYEQIRCGVLRGVSSRIGRRIFVNREALDELLKGGDHDA
jgi:excisionase family DNA binding protein